MSIEALRAAIAAGPTPGPWEFGSYGSGRINVGPVGDSKHAPVARMVGSWAIPWDATEESRQAFNDAAYIVAAVNSAPTLLAQRDELLAAVTNARDIIATDRQAFVDCNAIHERTTDLCPDSFVVYADGLWLTNDDAECVRDYDRALSKIDAAIAKTKEQA